MSGASDSSDGPRERYERVAALSAKLLTLLVGGPPDTPLELVVELLDALIQDARELEAGAVDASGEIRHRLFELQIELASAEPARRARVASSVAELERIGDQVADQRHALERAIGDAHQAFKQLAAAGGPPSRALLEGLTRVLSEIQSCAVRLQRLGYERTNAVSLAPLDPQHPAPPPTIAAAPRQVVEPAPPGTTIPSADDDDQLRGPISPPF